MKRPFDNVRELLFENLKRSSDNSKFIFEQSDKLAVWIVGFSIGGLSLIIANISMLNQQIPIFILRAVLSLLSISIICGILYRVSFYIYQIQIKRIELFLELSFSNKETMLLNQEDLTNETDIKEVVRRLNEDYGEDYSNILDNYNQLDEEKRTQILNELKDFYQRTSKWAQEDFDNAMTFAKDTYKKAFGFSQKRIDKLFNKPFPHFQIKIFGWTSIICFSATCLSFILSIIILWTTY